MKKHPVVSHKLGFIGLWLFLQIGNTCVNGPNHVKQKLRSNIGSVGGQRKNRITFGGAVWL
jgi:hypothetical protein